MGVAADAATLVVSAAQAATPAWAARLDGAAVVRVAAASELEAKTLAGVECVLVDAAVLDPVGVARRVRALDPTLQTVIVAPAATLGQLERAMLFAPGLGETWLVADDSVDETLVERAATITRQRRQYRQTRVQLAQGYTGPPAQRAARTLVSDAFLAQLLQVAPTPILSIDQRGAVLSWNPAAEHDLGHMEREVVGRRLVDVIAPEETAALEALLARGERATATGMLTFRRKGGESRVARVTVTPVEAAGILVRSVIFHDLTEERRAQRVIEEQAMELEMANEELQRRAGDLEAALAAKGRFYAAMSHELRTPINAIIGYTALLIDGILGPLTEKQLDGLRRSQRAAGHLLELINDVLDLAKIEAGRIEIEREPVPFPTLIQELLDTVRPLADEHGSPLVLELEDCPPVVTTDPRRVRQILLNLLSNAIKFGHGKPIDVRCERAPEGALRVLVTDRGPGIDPADVPRIFEEFVQLDGQQPAGTGLGLPISRRLSRMLGGSLEVASTPGEGSTFTLTLPLDGAG